MYKRLTDYLEVFQNDNIGTWVGTSDDSQFKFMSYSEDVEDFIAEVYAMAKRTNMKPYRKILDENGIKDIDEVNVSELDKECTFALIYAAIREEHFCDGIVGDLIKKGIIQSWLTHLKELDGLD